MPLVSNSPYKPGTAEDFTFRLAEDAAERNAESSGQATMAVSLGLAHVLRFVFKLPVLAFRLLKWVSLRVWAYGTVVRWTVIVALVASGLGVLLSYSKHDEIMAAQVRVVPAGIVLGLAMGMVRRSFLRKRLRHS